MTDISKNKEVKALINLLDGTKITNQAGIYFDRNDVVLTNTTLNTLYDNPYPIADFETKHSCTSFEQIYDFTYTGGTSDGVTFEWYFGPDATPSASTDENPAGILFDNTGAHEVVLTVNRYGCISSVTKTINIINVYCGKNKVLVCHIPPGNPENAHTICISINALPAHLALGDCVGPCLFTKKMLFYNNETIKSAILEAYPNPFKKSTTIIFYIPETGKTSIKIYNYLGQYTETLFNGIAETNKQYKLDFYTKTKGIYYAVLNTSKENKIIKIVNIK